MSALAGLWNFNRKPSASEDCLRMLAAQKMYGPHAVSHWDGGNIAVGRNLFRVLPEDMYDKQPLVGGDGRFVLVADIRLDNRRDLIRTLDISDDRASTLADSAILLAAWERWQEKCIDRLVGDYAFALWDNALQLLVLVRDPLGTRPLHYHRANDFIAFASMPKGIHTLPEVPREPDRERIAEYLALLPESGPRSFFKNVERVEAGCVVLATRSGVQSRRHWEPARKITKLANSDEYAEALRHHLDLAVRARLRGAGQSIAVHLSSGFDSSAVASSAAIQMGAGGGKVFAFTAVPRQGYDARVPGGRLGDESEVAAETARLYPNMEHILIRSGDRSPIANLDKNFLLYDRPVLNLCNATWLDAIHDAAQARKLCVLLTGQLGNMSISYGGLTLLPELISRGRILAWLREAAGLVRNGHAGRRGVLAATFGAFVPGSIWRALHRTFWRHDPGIETFSALNPSRLSRDELAARALEKGLDLSLRPRRDGFETRLWMMRLVDLGNLNKGTLAGWGIDSRDPTTDRRLIEFCLSVPEQELLQNGETKALTRHAFAGRISANAVRMRGKGYQAVDWHEGLTAARSAIKEEVERLGNCESAAEAIDLPRLNRLIEDWPQGQWDSQEVIKSYRLALLRAVSTGHFLRRASGSNA